MEVPINQSKFAEYVFENFQILIRSGFWGNITLDRFKQWKRQLAPEQAYYAAWIAFKLLYYNKKDFLSLISWSYSEAIRQIVVSMDQGNIITDENQWLELLKIAQRETIVCPFAADSPTSSGNMVARLLRDQELVDERYICQIEMLEPNLRSGRYRAVVFVDDMIGSGTQSDIFWKSRNILTGRSSTGENLYTSLQDILSQFDGQKYLAVALAPKNSIQEITTSTGIQVICAEMLTCRTETLSSPFWFEEDFEDGIRFLKELESTHHIPIMGFKETCWAVAFEHGVPDVASPFYGYSSKTWLSLAPRRGEDI